MAVIDYHSLSRRELQNLCKKHGIPANKTNAYMADALTSILKVNQHNVFGSATPTALSEDAGSESTPSTVTKQNKRGDSTISEVHQGNAFSSFEIGSKRTEPMEEDATPSIIDTCAEDPTEEYTKTGKETIDDTNKVSESKHILQHVALSVINDHEELCQHANQQNELGPKDHIALYEDAGIKSVPSKMEKQNERGDDQTSEATGLEGTNPMEEDSAPSVENTYDEKVSETTHVKKEKCNNTNKTIKAQQFLQQVQSHVLYNQEGHHQQENAIDRKGEEDSLLCIHSSSPGNKANERENHEAKTNTVYEKRMIHVERVEQLDQAKVVTRKGDEDSLLCTSSSSPCKEANNRVDHEAKMHTGDEQTPIHMQRVDHEAKMHTDDEQTPIHMQKVYHLGQEEHRQQDKIITRNADTHEDKICTVYEEMPIHVEGVEHLFQNKEIYTKNPEETTTGTAVLVSHEMLEKQSINDTDIDDRNGLLAKEMAIDEEAVKRDGPCNQPPFFSGDNEVDKSMIQIRTTEISERSSSTSFQFFVKCDNGVKLFVDLKNSSPLEWMKAHNYHFSLPQDLHGIKHCEHSLLKSVKYPTISEGDAKLEDRKSGSDKLADFQPQTSDFETSSNQNQTTCSSDFLKIQNFSSTPSKKMNVSRELRRISSVLIPPHGANRSLSPFMTQKLSRFSSTSQNANNISSFSSAIGNSFSTQVNQDNCLSECTQPIMTVTSKDVENCCMQLRVSEKEMLLIAKNQPDSETGCSIDGPVSSHTPVESVSIITPIEDRCQDVEMLDQQGFHYSSTETPKSKTDKELDFHLAEEGFQNNRKEAESVSQMHCPVKSQKEMHHKILLQDLQDEENRIISRYKDDYKKSPFTKNLRCMKNLARASSMRADILAKRRAMPLVENNSDCLQSSSVVHNLPYQSQNVQEKQLLHENLRGETGNYNVVSPRVHCETDPCASAKRPENEYSVIFPQVHHQERDFSVSGLTPGNDPLQNFCNISTPLALHGTVIGRDEARQSSTKISESNLELFKREISAISPGVHQETHLSVSGFPGKNPLRNICNISAPLTLMGPEMTRVSTGIGRNEARQNTRISESSLKLSGRPFQAFAKKRFFEKALEESTEKMHAQRMQQNAVNDYLSTQKKFVEKVPSNSVDCGYENQNRSNTSYLLDLNLINSSILETEDDFNRRVTECQKRHQEQFKTPLKGRSKEKAIEIAKKTAFVQRTEILNSKRGITSTN